MVAADFAKTINARLEGNPAAEFDHFAFDSRRMYSAQKSCFIALQSPHDSGKRYIAEAMGRGATVVLVDRWPEGLKRPEGVAVVLQESPMGAIQNWAQFRRKSFTGPVLAITGSNGKTVVKEWIHQLLGQDSAIHRTPGSFNSTLGISLSLSTLTPEFKASIIEVGIDRPHTMEAKAALVRPTLGLFTTLGDAHGEAFEDDDAKFAEKWMLFAGCERVACATKWYSKAKQLGLECPPALLWGPGEELDPEAWDLPFVGGHNAENAMAAISGALLLGGSRVEIESHIGELTPLDMRMQLLRAKDGGFLLEDTYSSDLSSLRYALEELKTQSPTGRKWAVLSVLGDEKSTAAAKAMVEQAGIDQSWWVRGTEDVRELTEAFAGMSLADTTVLVKGRRSFRLERFSATLREQYHSTWVDVDLGAMRENLRAFKSALQPTTKVMAMVKAASYGTGTLEVASWLEQLHVDYLGVAFAQEALTLRAKGVKTPILVMNAEPHQIPLLAAAGCDVELFRLGQLDPWKNSPQNEPLRLHLKIDTGMHRLGIAPTELASVLEVVGELENTTVAGVFTHLAATDNADHDAFTATQLEVFETCVASVRERYPEAMAHALNTNGIVRFPQGQFDMVRLGIGLYGVGRYEGVEGLQPVIRWSCRISQVGVVQPGESVGYSRAFMAEKPVPYATLPVGYADGLSRALSGGKGQVYIHGKPCPILGNVCMDMVMVDISAVPDAQPMDTVEILGTQQSADELANAAGTIGYEILTGIGSRVPRLYHKG
ncbi:MAG: hypothetical protein RL754_874 [Bacteroidota bacterium]|jgi:alanine racemase